MPSKKEVQKSYRDAKKDQEKTCQAKKKDVEEPISPVNHSYEPGEPIDPVIEGE